MVGKIVAVGGSALLIKGFYDGFVNGRATVHNFVARRISGLFNAQHIRRFPGQMLAPINADQLPGDPRRIKEIAQCRRYVTGIYAALQHRGVALSGEMIQRLAGALQGGAGANGVDADMRGKRLRRGLRQRPEAHFGDGVGHEFRRQFQHALVDHVQDHRLRRGLALTIGQGVRGLRGKRLGQHEGRAQVAFNVAVPLGAGGGGDGIMLEDRGVIDQKGQRPAQRIRRPRHQRLGFRLQQQIGA